MKIKNKGFTLVELMVVIAIISLLTGILTVNFTQSKARSRDARRVSDLNQIQLALEQYFDRCGQYPTKLDLSANNGCVGLTPAINFRSYISVVPLDPTNSGSNVYSYDVNANFTDYVLHASLEYGNSAQLNSYPDTLHLTSWPSSGFRCFDATSYKLDYCIGPK